MVGGECGLGVEVGRVGGLVADGLAGERRLVDVEHHGLQQFAVGRDLLAGVENHDVAHHDVLAGHLHGVAVADHLHGLVVVHLVEQRELLVGLQLEDEGQPRGQQDGDEDADGLEEYAGAFMQAPELVARDADRERAGDEEDDDQRVAEFLEKPLPQRVFLGRGQYVDPVLFPAFRHLGVGQAGVVLFFCHYTFNF